MTLRELFAAAERVANANVENYATMLSGLSPGASAAGSALNIALAPGRFDPLMGCQTTADGRETEQDCVDVFAKSQSITQEGSNSALGFDSDIFSFGVAGHQAVEDYALGASLSLERSSSSASDGLSRVDGDSVIFGLTASRDFGGMMVTGGLLGSSGSFDASRALAKPGGTETARGSYDARSAALRVRLEYSGMMGAAYLRPMLDLDAIYTSAGGYTETDAGGENLEVQGSSDSAFIVTPAVELGRVFDLGNGNGLRAYGRVGWTISSSDSYTATSRFAGAPSSVPGFDTALALPNSVGVIGAGAQLIGSDMTELDLRYDVAFGDGTSSNALSLWISKKF